MALVLQPRTNLQLRKLWLLDRLLTSFSSQTRLHHSVLCPQLCAFLSKLKNVHCKFYWPNHLPNHFSGGTEGSIFTKWFNLVLKTITPATVRQCMVSDLIQSELKLRCRCIFNGEDWYTVSIDRKVPVNTYTHHQLGLARNKHTALSYGLNLVPRTFSVIMLMMTWALCKANVAFVSHFLNILHLFHYCCEMELNRER